MYVCTYIFECLIRGIQYVLTSINVLEYLYITLYEMLGVIYLALASFASPVLHDLQSFLTYLQMLKGSYLVS